MDRLLEIRLAAAVLAAVLDDGSYEMYSVGLIEVAKEDPRFIAHDNAAGWVRTIDRYVSKDGLDWTDRRRVIAPDSRDPVDMQFYYLAAAHTPRGRIGMLGHYRVEAPTTAVDTCSTRPPTPRTTVDIRTGSRPRP